MHQRKFDAKIQNVSEEMEIEAGKLQTEAKESFGIGRFGNCQRELWNLIEHPTSSYAARVDLSLYFHNL